MLFAAFSCKAAPSNAFKTNSGDLEPDEQQMLVCQKIAQLISSYNYKKVELNDSISKIVFDRYIKSLDENHSYFLASDLADFTSYKTELDDDIKQGRLDHAFYIFNIFKKRYSEHMQYALAQLNQNFDFTTNETFTYDRSKLPWPASQNEMDRLWAQRVKYDLLRLKLANADMSKNKQTLKKRYQDLLSQIDKQSNQDVFQYFMDAFTGSIDPHTNYFNPINAANFNIEMSRQLEGIGVAPVSENEYITIKTIVPGGPADKSKQINLNDRIVGIAEGKTGEFQNIVGWRVENAISLIRGKKGTLVRLEILPAGSSVGSQTKIVELVREKIILQDQSAKKEVRTYQQNGKTVKVGIIAIPAFYIDFNDYRAGNPNYKSTTHDVKLLLDTLKREKVDAVVIDLRENGGGSLMEAVELTGLFIKNGPVVQVKSGQGRVVVEQDEDSTITYSGPLGILVDRFSASASEIFSGAIQDYGRGIIMGTQTYGKGSVQSPIDLDRIMLPHAQKTASASGSQSTYGQLNLTTGKFYRVSGSATQHKGVIPDISFPSIIPLDKYGEDVEPSAMPFDVIGKTAFTKTDELAPLIAQLKQLHERRMAKSDGYRYLLEDIAAFKKQDHEVRISLNEAELKKQRDRDDQQSFEKTNRRRVAAGLPPLKKGEKNSRNEDLDFIKREAGQIMADWINLV